ncbi:hypothetical protein AB833_26870 [Chromatiales bacterium (ex Bugula neritina AB1)]|nr:hypothetical protein AB833_26870 [Chromatiales bacterium (ex Bugula neritina AB1)]
MAANTRTESVEEAPPWAAATGTDSYGRWAAFELGDQSYRLRWIKPGEFLMGSPDEEPECSDNEALHTVTLSHGYWLAETAVSQALWQHVAGGNPSHFEGADLPVEQVSFDDIKNEFLPELNRILPAFNAQLPTEAQWEYACRAGTSTPFHFGDSLTTGLANYDGDYPYNGQKKGEYRSKTIPVSDLQINPWGLYQMHGNVWEWCADSPREFKKGETVVDPIGLEGQERVLRGGSWCGRGRSLRSACRLGFGPSLCGCNYGFRLAQVPEGLRSS